MKRRFDRTSMGLVLVFVAVLCLGAPAAFAAPSLDVQARWGPTNLSPGGKGRFVLQVRNVGQDPTTGTITLKDELPPGLTRVPPLPLDQPEGIDWSCSGTTTISCTSSTALAGLGKAGSTSVASYARRVEVEVKVAPGASGTHTNKATVSGGGSATATDLDPLTIGSTQAGFGMTQDSFRADVFGARYPAGSPVRQAGSHPFEMRVDFDLNLKRGEAADGVPGFRSPTAWTLPDGNVRTIETALPPGLFGNPEATPKCSGADFLAVAAPVNPNGNMTGCPPETQVGTVTLEINDGSRLYNEGTLTRIPVFNLEPPTGAPADFGFWVYGAVNVHILPLLDAANGYAIKAVTPFISSLGVVRDTRFTLWGVPGDSAHDLYRANTKLLGYGATVQGAVRPFVTMPMSCEAAGGRFAQRMDSWQEPGSFTTQELSPEAPVQVEGCDDPRIRFEPKVAIQPTSRAAGGPTGLTVNFEVPQRDQRVDDVAKLYAQNGNLHGIDTPPMKKAVVTMPEGMTLSTSAAQGLGNCTPEQIGIGTNSPVRCPENSRFGRLTLRTPILPSDEPMVGDIFIAQQHKNPFDNFLSMYFVIHDEDRGLLVKLPGKIDLHPKTGQIVTTFDDLPQFPVEDMELSFKSGVRAALVNPQTCGTKEIKAEFYSWADPDTPVVETSSYEITEKPDGSPCPNSLGERPFNPELSAGTLNPNAGDYSPFVFRLQRTDDDQEFSQLSTTLPPGLLANISKLTECPDAAIAQAGAPGRSGTEERLFPTCPASSQLGTTDVGSGVGQVITYIPGKAYLAGPYKGEPLSMVVITPILAGPYDLGVIAVRSAIHVNGERGQATISTDPFPQIYEGIPVRIRDIRVKADTPNTIINPTSCDPMAVTARVTGTGGDLDSTADDSAVDLSERFQAANCASLPFKPKLNFRLKGGTKRGSFPAFSAFLKGRPGDANIARSTVVLPGSLFIEQGHIRTVCTRVQFAADQCPAGSIYGKASAKSPLFDEVLSGPVYLRSNGGERLLPDLVVKLNGKIEVVLAGFVDSLDGRVRNTFDVIPDAPVEFFSLRMKGGKDSLVVNHRNLCISPSRATVRLTGQNGKAHNTKPVVKTSCNKGKKKKSSRQGGAGR